MRVRIAIRDPLPVFRRGVQAVLRDAGSTLRHQTTARQGNCRLDLDHLPERP